MAHSFVEYAVVKPLFALKKLMPQAAFRPLLIQIFMTYGGGNYICGVKNNSFLLFFTKKLLPLHHLNERESSEEVIGV
ncbi:hypothetical protein [Porphyromonas pogonae]|uniref:hypothetical protein n=1 Tax=Porphyromonas pogonae TaxID=867595 RepID=UPI002E75AED5|nr:hypothetical protein [Porphyromonas pogonae]